MKNFKMAVFVMAVALILVSANAAAQNLGEVVFQETVDTSLQGSLLYHFVAKVGTGFDTAISLTNVRTAPATPPTPGTFTIWMISNTPNTGGTAISGTSEQLTNARYNTILVGGKRALVETASFFAGEFLADRLFTGNFVGYAIVNHSFKVGTGVANVIDFSTGTGFNITYPAAQYNRTAATTNTKD
ncbi:MAG: hypothetical protein HYX74_03030 [Acidobacteria bacterium]|nr:hypothetical protein [Acidobacteriota bacterium]